VVAGEVQVDEFAEEGKGAGVAGPGGFDFVVEQAQRVRVAVFPDAR
jgi:hypothetical protein